MVNTIEDQCLTLQVDDNEPRLEQTQVVRKNETGLSEKNEGAQNDMTPFHKRWDGIPAPAIGWGDGVSG